MFVRTQTMGVSDSQDWVYDHPQGGTDRNILKVSVKFTAEVSTAFEQLLLFV